MDVLTHQHPNISSRLAAGAVAGIIGGILMAMFEMFYHGAITGMGVFTMPNMIATNANFEMHHDFGMYTMVGMIMHLVFSAFLGMAWGAVFSRTPSKTTALVGGLLFGYIMYLVMFYLVMPPINPMFEGARGMVQIIAHLIFGVGFIFYPGLAQKMS